MLLSIRQGRLMYYLPDIYEHKSLQTIYRVRRNEEQTDTPNLND